MISIKQIVFLITFLLLSFVGISQKQTDYLKHHKRQLKTANKHFEAKEYAAAVKIYKHIEDSVRGHLITEEELLFKIGKCYYNSALEKDKSIAYFEAYLQQTDSLEEVKYYLAQTYHFYHRFDEAITYYELFKKHLLNDKETEEEILEEIIEGIEHDIARCNYGKILVNVPVDAVIENLGPKINTEYSEYAPVINHKEDKLVFTRRSPHNIGGKVSPDGNYFEDIYTVEVTGGQLIGNKTDKESGAAGYYSLLKKFKSHHPKNIGENINTSSHEGGIQFSADGKRLYIYHGHNIWASDFEHNKWQKTYRLDEMEDIINTKSYEPSVSISEDEHKIYISSERAGGYGGLDIWVSTKQRDGSWGDAENLGPTINTPFDEDGPYIDPNGRTLYFSSKGHSSMGGYDVFKSSFNGEQWSAPQNMGFPINSAGDDIFYMMTPLFNRAYYSSNKFGGYGKMDLYRLTFADERTPLAEVKGYIKVGEELAPVRAKITVVDKEHNVDLYTLYSDSVTGAYSLMFGHGKKYSLRVETKGFLPYEKEINIPKQSYYYQFYQEIHHIHFNNGKGEVLGEKTEMYNTFFNETDEENNSTAKDTVSFDKSVDVTFYMSEDSLNKIVVEEPDLEILLPDEAVISYFDPANDVGIDDMLIHSLEDTLKMSDLSKKAFVKADSVPSIVVIQPKEELNLSSTVSLQKIVVKVEANLLYVEDVIKEREEKMELLTPMNNFNSSQSILNGLKPKLLIYRELSLDTLKDINKQLDRTERLLELFQKELGAIKSDKYIVEIKDLLSVSKSELHSYTSKLSYEIKQRESTEAEEEEIEVIDLMYIAEKNLARAEYALEGIYDMLDNPSLYEHQASSTLKESKRLLQETLNSVKETKKALEKDKEHSIGARASMEETEKLIYLTQQAIVKANQIFVSIEEYTTLDKDSLQKMKEIIAKTQNSLKQSEVALSKVPESNNSFDESLEIAKNHLHIIELSLDSIGADYANAENMNLNIIETQLALLKIQKIANDSMALSIESRKSISETQVLLRGIQNSILLNAATSGVDSLNNGKLEEAKFLIRATQNSIKETENKLVGAPLSNLPALKNAEVDEKYLEEKGVTQRDIMNVIGSLIETQEVLNKMLEILPQNKADKTRVLELQVKSQQMLAASMDDPKEMLGVLEQAEQMLVETQRFIVSTKLYIEDNPNTTITLREYYEEFEAMLNKTSQAINVVQKVLKKTTQKPVVSDNRLEEKPLIIKNGKPFKIIIYFAYDKDDLTPESAGELVKLEQYMKENTTAKCSVVGHTDAKGSDDYNLKLSKRRANQALQFMLKKGIVKSRFVVSGKGEGRPIAPNKNPDGTDNSEGRKLNRRVEFEVFY